MRARCGGSSGAWVEQLQRMIAPLCAVCSSNCYVLLCDHALLFRTWEHPKTYLKLNHHTPRNRMTCAQTVTPKSSKLDLIHAQTSYTYVQSCLRPTMIETCLSAVWNRNPPRTGGQGVYPTRWGGIISPRFWIWIDELIFTCWDCYCVFVWRGLWI